MKGCKGTPDGPPVSKGGDKEFENE